MHAKQGKRSIVLNKNSGYLNEFLVKFCNHSFLFISDVKLHRCCKLKCIYWIVEDLSVPVKFA